MSRSFFPALVSLFLCWMLSPACTSDRQEKQENVGEGTEMTLTAADKACLASPDVICEPGLSFAMLGQSMLELKLPQTEIREVIDSVMRGGGYYWNSKTLRTATGDIVLEGDFIDDRQENQEMLPENNRIFRIRVEASALHTAQGIGIGNNVGDIKNNIHDAELQAMYLPDFQAIDISSPQSRIRYLVRDENGQFSDRETPSTVSMEEIPDAVQIYAFVLIRDF